TLLTSRLNFPYIGRANTGFIISVACSRGPRMQPRTGSPQVPAACSCDAADARCRRSGPTEEKLAISFLRSAPLGREVMRSVSLEVASVFFHSNRPLESPRRVGAVWIRSDRA